MAAGQKVLINGASGGVGTFAVQIATALGAQRAAPAGRGLLGFIKGALAGGQGSGRRRGLVDSRWPFTPLVRWDVAGRVPAFRLAACQTVPAGPLAV
jgi:hypothetical protein